MCPVPSQGLEKGVVMLSLIGIGLLIVLAGVELGIVLSFVPVEGERYDWIIVGVCAPGLVAVAGILAWVAGISC